MAVLHCHTCGWEQDDFWRKTYNPLTKLVQLFSWLWIPRYIKFDEELYGRKYIFSWHMLSIRIVEEIVNIMNMRWWTEKDWEKDKETAACPKCGDRNFDID